MQKLLVFCVYKASKWTWGGGGGGGGGHLYIDESDQMKGPIYGMPDILERNFITTW